MHNLDLLPQTADEFVHRAAVLVPNIVVAIGILILGWLLAKVARFLVERALRAVNFNVLTERAGTDHFLQQGGLQGDTTTLFGLFTYWVVLVATLMEAASEVDLVRLTDLLNRVLLYSPKVLVAMLIAVFGSYFARFVGNAITTYCNEAQIPDADLLGKMAQYLVMAFVLMIALRRLEVGADIVELTFLLLLGGVVLALALAFGLGGKDWAAALLERWWPRHGNKDR
jgi:hypothetical protein